MTRDEMCAQLGVDGYGLDRLATLGELADGFDERALSQLAQQRQRIRTQALHDLAKLDGPHLAPGDTPCEPITCPEPPEVCDHTPPAVFIDACVLAGAIRRHLVLSLAEIGLIYPRWSERVLFETGHAHARIVSDKPNRDGPGEAARLVMALEQGWPEALVPDDLAQTITLTGKLPDPDDAHVMQAAAAGQSGMILTENMKDFPRATLKPLGLYARPTIEFIASLLGKYPDMTSYGLIKAAHRLGLSPARFQMALKRSNLNGLAKKLGL